MKNIYPEFYKNFKCIANACPDSCCKDWDVVVDDTSQSFYQNVGGCFGKKLKELTTIDGDGDRIFISQNGKCPFWNDRKLCDIYINLGEEHLCKTCRDFPRLTLDYTVFAEHILSFACPQAARLMLENPNDFNCYQADFKFCDTVEYNEKLMKFLIDARKITFEILSDQNQAFSERIKKCLDFNNYVQNQLNSYDYRTQVLDNFKYVPRKTHNSDHMFILKLHQQLDTMSDKWQDILNEIIKNADMLNIPSNYDSEFLSLALYYVFRYYLNAIDSFDVLSTIKRIVCAVVVIGGAEAFLKRKKGTLTFEERTEIFQLYSKEVEHSYENGEMLDEEFLLNPNFSAENLIDIL